MFRKLRFILIVYLLLINVSNGEICPAPCICKKIKAVEKLASGGTSGDTLKAQCGGFNNKISSIDEIDLSTLRNDLVQLDLSSNAISEISTHLDLPNLQKLDLTKNKISKINGDVFKNLVNLKRLDLSSNSLKTVEKIWLSGLQNLERIKLSGNFFSTIAKGTFDELISLKQLDISGNPLTCDCDLLWLIDWLQSTAVKLTTSPKCAAPPSFKGQMLRKIKIGVDIHCRSPVGQRDPTEIELKPDKSQVIYEGDSFKIRCRAPSVTPDVFISGEEPYSSARIFWRYNLEDPNEKFREIKVENRFLDDSGMVDSILNIGIVTRNHSGEWTCHLVSDKGNHSKAISLFVISNATRYCNSSVTLNNKGTYIWPRTIIDNVVEQQCQGQQLSGFYRPAQAVRYCTEFGTWKDLNTSACPYISETTKILEQFSKVDLNLTIGNLLETVRHLRNYTMEGGRLLKDKMDIVFIARTIENYINFVKVERDLGGFLIEMINSLLRLNKKLLEDAQTEDRACSRLVKAVETIAKFTPSPQSSKPHLAFEDFDVKPENFKGLICAWYTSSSSQNQQNVESTNIGGAGSGRASTNRPFYCTTSANLPYMMRDDETIAASIQIPSSLFLQLQSRGISFANSVQLVVAMYANGKFFPTYQMKEVVTSSVVGATLVGFEVENLTDPVTVMFRYPLLQDVETPVLGWWDFNFNNGIGGWNKNGCTLAHYLHENLIFSCNRLNYFGMLQDIQYASTNTFSNFHMAGAKFRFSHPAIYAGTLILITCLFITILTYLLCYNSIQMAKRSKHSLINTWIALSLLTYLFAFGIFQTEDVAVCQVVGIVLHYLTLCVLLWMCVSVTTMYKRLSKSTCSIRLPDEDELPPAASDPQQLQQPIQKPILGLYLVGWGIALIVCGISGAVNMREYASHTYCFLYSAPALSAVFVPAFILIIFIVICTLMIRCVIRCSDVHGQLSEGTQATENVDLDLLDANLPNLSIDRNSFRSYSASRTTDSSKIEDPEHCPNTQLKAYNIALILYILLWISGALSTRRIMKNYIPYDEHIFSILYAIFSILLGSFILFFYGIARSDVRSCWTYVKRIWCRSRTVSDANMNSHQSNLNCAAGPATSTAVAVATAASASGLIPTEINNSRPSSRTSSHTKSHNSNILKAAVDLNSVVTHNDPNAEAKIANVNLVVLHRQQYRTNNTIPIYSDHGINGTNNAEMFYNPHQSTVARKFFKKQRKNMIKHNNLSGTSTATRRRVGINNDDNTSIISSEKSDKRNSLNSKLAKQHSAIANNLFGSGTKVNNTNIHVEPPLKELKQQNKNILLTDSPGDEEESEILINHVAGSVNRLLAENMRVRARYTHNNDGSPKRRDEENEIVRDMRTVSQQCSLEYSSCDDELDGDLIADKVDFENLTPENNEEISSITDQDEEENTNPSSYNPESVESVHSHVIYPKMPRSVIYENPLHLLLNNDDLDQQNGSTTTLDSETLFARYYQPSSETPSAIQSIASDDDFSNHGPSRRSLISSSTSDLDAIYEQIGRSNYRPHRHQSQPQIGDTDDDLLSASRQSPVLFPPRPSISFESGLNDIEINKDFRFNAQGIVASSCKLSSENDEHLDESDMELKKETTV